MKRLPVVVFCGVVGALALAEDAWSQSREFFCGEQNVFKLKVIDSKTISAGPIGGRTIALKQAPGKPMTYANGGTSVEIALDQKRIAVRVAGDDPLDCVYPLPSGAAQRSAGASGDPSTAAKPTVKKPVAGTAPKAVATTAPKADATTAPKSFAAQSGGGAVRSGPGMEFKQIGSLRPGEKITVVEDAGVEMNGYRWFKIRFGANKTGFQWGGILCPTGKPVAGAFQGC